MLFQNPCVRIRSSAKKYNYYIMTFTLFNENGQLILYYLGNRYVIHDINVSDKQLNSLKIDSIFPKDMDSIIEINGK